MYFSCWMLGQIIHDAAGTTVRGTDPAALASHASKHHVVQRCSLVQANVDSIGLSLPRKNFPWPPHMVGMGGASLHTVRLQVQVQNLLKIHMLIVDALLAILQTRTGVLALLRPGDGKQGMECSGGCRMGEAVLWRQACKLLHLTFTIPARRRHTGSCLSSDLPTIC